MTPTTEAGIAIMATLPEGMSIPGTVMAGAWVMVPLMVDMETLRMRVGLITAAPLTATIIQPGHAGTGAKMHGIIAVGTSIITDARVGRENI